MQLTLAIQQCMHAIDRTLGEAAADEGLAPNDLLLLSWLIRLDGISAVHLAENTCRPRQSVQRALERLERKGMVVRDRHDDLPLTLGWGLSDEGLEVWRRVKARYERIESRLIPNKERAKNFLHMVTGLAEAFRTKRPPRMGYAFETDLLPVFEGDFKRQALPVP